MLALTLRLTSHQGRMACWHQGWHADTGADMLTEGWHADRGLTCWQCQPFNIRTPALWSRLKCMFSTPKSENASHPDMISKGMWHQAWSHTRPTACPTLTQTFPSIITLTGIKEQLQTGQKCEKSGKINCWSKHQCSDRAQTRAQGSPRPTRWPTGKSRVFGGLAPGPKLLRKGGSTKNAI